MNTYKEVFFYPNEFFELSNFSHRALFSEKKPVWQIFHDLKIYIDSLVSKQNHTSLLEGVFVENPQRIFLGRDVCIEKGAYLHGPCWIGDGTVIRSGAYVRQYVITGKNCVIGHGTEVKHSILLDYARAAHFNYIGDSILGNGVNLGAGAKCANSRFDKKPISIRFSEKKIETGLEKMGAILGDHSQMGCNAVANPGTLFFPNVTCAPCTNVSGVYLSPR